MVGALLKLICGNNINGKMATGGNRTRPNTNTHKSQNVQEASLIYTSHTNMHQW